MQFNRQILDINSLEIIGESLKTFVDVTREAFALMQEKPSLRNNEDFRREPLMTFRDITFNCVYMFAGAAIAIEEIDDEIRREKERKRRLMAFFSMAVGEV